MGRGRGRGRGKASVTASPVASAVEPPEPVAVCYRTLYDGVDDYFTSTASELKFSGALVIACEINTISQTANDTIFWNRSPSGPSAAGTIFKLNGSGVMYALTSESGVNSQATSPSSTIVNGTWHKVMMIQRVNDAVDLWVDGSLSATGSGVLTGGVGATSVNAYLATAGDATSRVLDGYMRNFTIWSGEPSSPGSWTPTDPSSLAGCTEVLYSLKGNDENRNSLSFTKFGDPITDICP